MAISNPVIEEQFLIFLGDQYQRLNFLSYLVISYLKQGMIMPYLTRSDFQGQIILHNTISYGKIEIIIQSKKNFM